MASIKQPGGNLTFISVFSVQLVPKSLQLAREIIGNSGVIAFLLNPKNPNAKVDSQEMEETAKELFAAFSTFRRKRSKFSEAPCMSRTLDGSSSDRASYVTKTRTGFADLASVIQNPTALLGDTAEAAMPPALLSYVQGGCGDEFTQRRNVEAFRDWGLVPRMLVDTSRRDLSIELFGMKLPHPLFMCPIGVAGIGAQDGHGDLAIAEAARASGFPVTISTLGNDPIEKVGAVLGDGIGFFQLYTPKDRGLAKSFVKQAENSGFKALIVTLDTWIPGWRPRDLSGCCSKSFRLSPRGKQPVHPILMSPVKYTAHGFPSPRGLIVKFLH